MRFKSICVYCNKDYFYKESWYVHYIVRTFYHPVFMPNSQEFQCPDCAKAITIESNKRDEIIRQKWIKKRDKLLKK